MIEISDKNMVIRSRPSDSFHMQMAAKIKAVMPPQIHFMFSAPEDSSTTVCEI